MNLRGRNPQKGAHVSLIAVEAQQVEMDTGSPTVVIEQREDRWLLKWEDKERHFTHPLEMLNVIALLCGLTSQILMSESADLDVYEDVLH
jgi:hypothetical protein